MVRAQMKIQQMAIMILAVFIFFVLAGLFFLTIQTRGVFQNHEVLQKNDAIASLKSLYSLTEFNCAFKNFACVDEDKLIAMSEESDFYSQYWGVSSIEVYKIYPTFTSQIECPGTDCNHYNIYDSNKNKTITYSTFISICKESRIQGMTFDNCEIGKLVVGVA